MRQELESTVGRAGPSGLVWGLPCPAVRAPWAGRVEAGSEGCGHLPGAGLGSSRHAPRPALRAPLTRARRRPAAASIRAGPDRAGARRSRVQGAGSPQMLRRPGGRGLFIAPGHHVGGVAGDRLATWLVVAPTPAA